MYFESLPYTVYHEGENAGLINYDALEASALIFRPKLLLCGGSAYCREWDYPRLRAIADACGAYLLCDMAHISGLVATGVANSPFEFADIVTSTTHKSLRGPRSGMVFWRKDHADGFTDKINQGIFPMCQGGPHENTIAALAVQFKEVNTPEFKEYAAQVVTNAQALAAALIERGHSVVTNGTDNHIVLWDMRPKGVTGSKMEKILDLCHITVNKNTLYGDKSALTPGGVRLGSCALTTRRYTPENMATVADFLVRCADLAAAIQEKVGKKLVDFNRELEGNAEVEAIKAEVIAFGSSHYMPGWDIEEMKTLHAALPDNQ